MVLRRFIVPSMEEAYSQRIRLDTQRTAGRIFSGKGKLHKNKPKRKKNRANCKRLAKKKRS